MPRPRFLKLDAEKQRAILDAARTEFSECGYEAASQNRVIEAAGISKGALYYYFDDKNDLYITVLLREFEGLRAILEIGTVTSADEFWAEIHKLFARCDDIIYRSAESLALARSVARSFGRHEVPPGLQDLMDETRQVAERFVHMGQPVGAVRTDLPVGLLVSIVIGMGQGMDLWFADHLETLQADQLLELNAKLVALFRRVMAPES